MNDFEIQRLFRSVPGRFIVLRSDPGFTIVAASEDYFRATYTDQSIIGRPVFDVFPDNLSSADAEDSGIEIVAASLGRVLLTREPETVGTFRYDIRQPDSLGGAFEERYWRTVNSPVLDEQGNVEYIIHRIDEASTRSNREAMDILESITEGFFMVDRQWRFGYANHEAERILGRRFEELAGRVLWEQCPGIEGTQFDRAFRRTMQQRDKSSFVALYPPRDRWYEVTTFPAPEGMSVYFRDVTDQKAEEAERSELMIASEKQRRIYETALDSTPDFVYVFDLEHRAIYANEALMKTWGVGDVRGKTWTELGYEQWHADLHDREIDQVIATNAPVRGEIPFTGTNGRRVYDYIFAPVLGAGGEVVAVAGTTRDITARQAAEQAIREHARALAESDRAKDDFLATLSHELRNPLAPLRNSIELLRMIGSDNPKLAPIHPMMERQVNHLVRLVDDLLEMSRISRGTLSLRRERVMLSSIVRNAVETSEPLISAARHELVVEVPEQPLWLEGDQVRLAQILSNLLNNAARYTEDGGHILVRARREDDHAVISVIDNGMGMTAEALPRMFEMFSRGDRDSSRSQGGLGIGLALSLRLTRMHKGTLKAYSDGIGKGSCFTVQLPLAKASAEEPAAPLPTPKKLEQTRILVVDDNHDAGDSLGQILGMLGAQVRVARDGAEALDVFSAYRPEVVLLDIGMPGMNGYEVARTLRSRHPGNPATLVALTGWGQEEDRRRAVEAGFDLHLLKPADINALQQLLSSLDAPPPHVAEAEARAADLLQSGNS
ncbi:MAG: PAS domain-containing protein [Pseudomonadota bacterium]|nr:PAS domain-containing protein [Pseudomonadota bacterium]